MGTLSGARLILIVGVVVAFLAGCQSAPQGHTALRPTPTSSTTSTSAPSTTAPSPTAQSSTAPAPSTAPTPAPSDSLPTAPGSASAALASLPVKGRAPMTGYSRDQFGPAWADVDHNGCDTRNDVLRDDMQNVQPARGCIVTSGVLAPDPYSGTVIDFTRGATSSERVQIDHVVALGDAWQSGAQSLTLTTRTLLGNDPYNLLAVDGALNEQKGDANAASWLPPNGGYRCQYVARQVGVKVKYGLWVTAPERGRHRPRPGDVPRAAAAARPGHGCRPRSGGRADHHAIRTRVTAGQQRPGRRPPWGLLYARRRDRSDRRRHGNGLQACLRWTAALGCGVAGGHGPGRPGSAVSGE